MPARHFLIPRNLKDGHLKTHGYNFFVLHKPRNVSQNEKLMRSYGQKCTQSNKWLKNAAAKRKKVSSKKKAAKEEGSYNGNISSFTSSIRKKNLSQNSTFDESLFSFHTTICISAEHTGKKERE